MSFPQTPNDPQSQQPGYPPPSATASGTNSLNFAALTTPENRAYLIAGVGGLLALIAYLFLPFYTVSGTGVFGAVSSSATGSGMSGSSGWLYLPLLGSIVALVVAALLALGIRAVPQLTPQLGTRVILGSGAVALIGLVLYLIQANNATSGLSGLTSVAGSSISYGVGFGFWVAIIASIGILVGGVMQMRKA
jgi:glucan phosphoethanolaminetransferase (alkaline phosphatase superfamily)